MAGDYAFDSKYWRDYIVRSYDNEKNMRKIRETFEELVKEEKAKLGQWETNEFGPECP